MKKKLSIFACTLIFGGLMAFISLSPDSATTEMKSHSCGTGSCVCCPH